MEPCAIVVELLNRNGAPFSPPIVPPDGRESGIDCVSTSSSGETLNFQVTRAMRDQEFWQHFGTTKGAMSYREITEIVDDLWDTISSKADRLQIRIGPRSPSS